MGYRKVIDEHYGDFNNLCDTLSKLVNTYRLLVGGAGELNNVSLAKKSEVKEAIDRASKAGDIIDKVLDILDKTGDSYFKYCKIKNDYLYAKASKDVILTEIDYELDFNNESQGEAEEPQ